MTKTMLHIAINTNLINRFRKRYVLKKGQLSEGIEILIKDALKENKVMMFYNPKLKKALMKKSVEV